MPVTTASSSDSTLAHDVLVGGEAIALFMFGDASQRKRVFNLAENNALPVFRLGRTLAARKSTLMRWIEEQEQPKRAMPSAPPTVRRRR